MEAILDLAAQWGLWLVFFAVLVEQLGIPVPSYPTLIVTSAYAERGGYTPVQILLVAIAASLVADLTWFQTGLWLGRKVLWRLCRISISADNCVRRSEEIFERWGLPSLIVAKFFPGIGTVATAMAGVIRSQRWRFIAFDAAGALLYLGLGIILGRVFRNTVTDVLRVIGDAGRVGLVAVAAALLLLLIVKFIQRQRFLHRFRMARVTVPELQQRLASDQPPLLVDVQSASGRRATRIPGSYWIDTKADDARVRALPAADDVVVYCACPNEASAAVVAKRLLLAGYARVHPLKGGIEGWRAAGLEVESGEESLAPGEDSRARPRPTRAPPAPERNAS